MRAQSSALAEAMKAAVLLVCVLGATAADFNLNELGSSIASAYQSLPSDAQIRRAEILANVAGSSGVCSPVFARRLSSLHSLFCLFVRVARVARIAVSWQSRLAARQTAMRSRIGMQLCYFPVIVWSNNVFVLANTASSPLRICAGRRWLGMLSSRLSWIRVATML